MKFIPYDYQEVGIDFIVGRKRCLLWDEMGLGKTIQSLGAVDREGKDVDKFNTLVVCRASLCMMWVEFIRAAFGEDVCVVEIRNAKTAVTLYGKYRFVVASNAYLRKNWTRLTKVKWHRIIVDEYQDFTNPGSQQYKGLKAITDKSNAKVVLMTGTLIKTKGEQYWSALNFCEPGKWGNIFQFRNRFCEIKVDWFSGANKYLGIRADKIEIINKAFKRVGLRRLLKDHAKELPPVSFQDVYITTDYKPEDAGYGVDLDTGLFTGVEHLKIKTELMRLGFAKADPAAEFIASIGRPVIAFCFNPEVCERIKFVLVKQGIKTGIISGRYSRAKQHKAKEDFQNGGVEVLLLTHETGGSGLTLTRAADCVFVQYPWSPADYWQCCKRIYRKTQEAKSVRYYNLVVKGSYDDYQLSKLIDRSEFMRGVSGDIKEGTI